MMCDIYGHGGGGAIVLRVECVLLLSCSRSLSHPPYTTGAGQQSDEQLASATPAAPTRANRHSHGSKAASGRVPSPTALPSACRRLPSRKIAVGAAANAQVRHADSLPLSPPFAPPLAPKGLALVTLAEKGRAGLRRSYPTDTWGAWGSSKALPSTNPRLSRRCRRLRGELSLRRPCARTESLCAPVSPPPLSPLTTVPAGQYRPAERACTSIAHSLSAAATAAAHCLNEFVLSGGSLVLLRTSSLPSRPPLTDFPTVQTSCRNQPFSAARGKQEGSVTATVTRSNSSSLQLAASLPRPAPL